MTSISIHPEYEELLKKLEQLKEQISAIIEEKEYLINHKFKYLKTEYILKIGSKEYDLFVLDCQIGKLQRKIEMVQASINMQMPVDLIHIDKLLDKEFRDYMKTLEEMAKDQEIANIIKDSEALTTEEAVELKKLYRSLVKQLHPDLNPDITETQKVLWERIVKAYEASDLNMLKILGAMVGKEEEKDIISKDNISELEDRIIFYENRILKILEHISKIESKFPFNLEDNLNDDNWVEERQMKIKADISDAKKVVKDLEDYLLIILPSKTKYSN